jgi:hypothetical protein
MALLGVIPQRQGDGAVALGGHDAIGLYRLASAELQAVTARVLG